MLNFIPPPSDKKKKKDKDEMDAEEGEQEVNLLLVYWRELTITSDLVDLEELKVNTSLATKTHSYIEWITTKFNKWTSSSFMANLL